MKAVIRSANRNTTLSKESLEPAYTVEPVREKNNKYFIFLLLCNRYSFHTIYIQEHSQSSFTADTFRAIAVPAKSEGRRSGTILATQRRNAKAMISERF